jgi:hypothetical protein
MKSKLLALVLIAAAALAARSFAFAEADKEPGAAVPPEIKLPEGWTAEDMKACILAAQPGKQHELLAKDVGVWQGKTTMWMGPGGEPMKSECVSTVTPIMDGRYIKCEIKGDMPGMGPFQGFGIYGFDNVSQKYVSAWIDNQSTGLMTGTGELSDDGKVLTWNYTFNCPLTKKPVALREVDSATGENSKTLEMFGPDPKTGKEYKMMSIEFTRQGDAPAAGG